MVYVQLNCAAIRPNRNCCVMHETTMALLVQHCCCCCCGGCCFWCYIIIVAVVYILFKAKFMICSISTNVFYCLRAQCNLTRKIQPNTVWTLLKPFLHTNRMCARSVERLLLFGSNAICRCVTNQ